MLNTKAEAVCLTVSSDTVINASTTSCVIWSSANLTLTNSGVLTGAAIGVNGTGNTGTLTNSGVIDGTSYGLSNTSGATISSIVNNAGGTITAVNNAAIQNAGSIGSLSNSGLITISTTHSAISAIVNSGTIGSIANNSGGIIAGGTGIYNSSGSIGAVTNSGAITAAGFGIDNAAVLGALTNQGSISGSTAIYNIGGSISSLTNEAGGTISGSAEGIYNLGHIGSLANSGVITSPALGIFNVGNIDSLTNMGTISSTVKGLANGGTIGSLTNTAAGIISGGATGIANSWTIGALSNSGTITGGSYGIYNYFFGSSIGPITNSGTITGAIDAIRNAIGSSIGPITNSGLIAGNILNESTSSLTINGGTGSTFGTLTGASGGLGSADRGTITSTASDLLFSAGNILLNDNIDMGSGSVVNSGATLRLDNAIAVTGSYNQTAGTLLITTSGSGASYGYLNVSGNAVVSNSSLTITGSGLSAGQTFTIVRAGGSGTYTNDAAFVGVTNGLGATVSTVGDNLVVTLAGGNTANTYTQKGAAAGGVGVPMGITLDQIRNSSSQQSVAFQDGVLTYLDALPTGSQGNAIKQLAPNQNPPGREMSLSANNTLIDALEQHQQGGAGASAGSESYGSALWGQFLGGGARQDTTASADGYRTRDYGFAAGLDHQFMPSFMAGVALSWVRVNANGLDNSTGTSSKLDNYQLTFYGTYRRGAAFVDAQVGGGYNQIDQQRRIGFLGTTAYSNFSGAQYVVKATGGYDVNVRGLIVTPFASLQWLQATTGAYTETGAGAASLAVDKNTSSSLTQDLGVKVASNFATRFGTLTPEVRLSWVHDYTNGPIVTSGLIGGQTFAVNVPRASADGARIGLGATLSGDSAFSLRARYEGEFRDGYVSNTGLVKASWGF